MQRNRSIPRRLAEKILQDIGIECDPSTFRRTYAGRNQKAAGAFVWVMLLKERPENTPADMWLIGSIEPATKLVKKKYKLTFDRSEGEIFGEEEAEE